MTHRLRWSISLLTVLPQRAQDYPVRFPPILTKKPRLNNARFPIQHRYHRGELGRIRLLKAIQLAEIVICCGVRLLLHQIQNSLDDCPVLIGYFLPTSHSSAVSRDGAYVWLSAFVDLGPINDEGLRGCRRNDRNTRGIAVRRGGPSRTRHDGVESEEIASQSRTYTVKNSIDRELRF